MLLDQLVLKVLKVIKEALVVEDQLVHRVLKVLKVIKVLVVQEDQQVLKVHKDIKDNLELMQVKVLRVLQVLKVLQVHRDQQVHKVVHQPTQFQQVELLYGLEQQTQFRLVGCYVMVQIAHLT